MIPMSNSLKGKVIFLATGNIHKFNEVRQILEHHNVAVGMLRKIDSVEIQSDMIETIARESAIDAFRKCHLPLVVEHAGLFIEALSGFPGPYSSYVF